MAETAIALIGSYGIKEGADPLLKILEKRDMFGAQTTLRLRVRRSRRARFCCGGSRVRLRRA